MNIHKKIYKILNAKRKIVGSIYNKWLLKINGVKIGSNFGANGRIYIRNYAEISIGKNVWINLNPFSDPIGGNERTILYTTHKGLIKIGNNVGISNTVIYSDESVIIEDNVCIGGGTKIYDTDFHSVKMDERLNGNCGVNSKAVHIKSGAFIGGHSIILKGVTVGEGAVVGAGSVVTKSVPDKEIWAGCPAALVKKII